MRAPSETTFLLRRAHEEAVQAVRSDGTAAGKVHGELSLLYSKRAVRALQAVGPASRYSS